jgi:hypothetical protein
MSRFLSVCLLAGYGIVSVLAASHSLQKTSMAGDRANASQATIEGLVRRCRLSHSEPGWNCD